MKGISRKEKVLSLKKYKAVFREKKVNNSKETGITLIALVITIIVLLILAGVTIATLTGENGILTQTERAKEETRASEVEERVNLWKTEKESSKYTNESVKTDTDLIDEMINDGILFEDEVDRDSQLITIGKRVIDYATEVTLTDIYVALYNDGTLVFNNKNEFDINKLADGWTIENIKDKKYEYIITDEDPYYDVSKMPKWFMSEKVIKINFLNEIVPEHIEYWFCDLANLTYIENISNLNTSYVTDMSGMFVGCSSLQRIDLTGLNTENVTNISNMFAGCSSLQRIDLTGLNVESVTDMSRMFEGCSSLQMVDLTGLNTENVTNMSNMFRESGLQTINLSVIDTKKVNNMNSMFFYCTKLSNIDLEGLDTSSVTNMGSMFYGCSKLTNIDVSSFNTSNVTNMMHMFNGCTGLTELNVSNFDITLIKNDDIAVKDMFKDVTCPITISPEWTENMKIYSQYSRE